METVPAPSPGPLPAPVPVEPVPAAPLLLQYDTGRPRRRPIELALFLPATVAGAVAAFLPLTWDVSPFDVVIHSNELFAPTLSKPELMLFLLAWPFLVPVAMLAFRLRTLLIGPLSSPERKAAYVVAGLASAAVVSCVAVMAIASSQWDEYAMTAIGGGLMAAGGLMFLRVVLQGGGDRAAAVALLVPYVANGAVALFGFHDNPEIGWYVSLAAAGAALAEIIVATAASRKRP